MKQTVEAYSLPDFVQAVQAKVRDGWLVDFDDNESIPVSWTGYYRCRMQKGGQVAALLLPPEQVSAALKTKSFASTDAELSINEESVGISKTVDDFLQSSQPFEPSIVFTVEQAIPAPKPKVGRPKGAQI